jgi:hypothetical protein
MIAMPYIVVDIVFSKLAPLFFAITSAALLSRYPFANFWLPARLRSRRILAFVAHALVLSVLALAAVQIIARAANISTHSPRISDPFFIMGLINSLVLAYQFIDQRYFLNTAKLQRRLVIAILSLVVVLVPAFAVVIAVIGLLIIK